MFQEITFNTLLQLFQDARTVCGRKLEGGGRPGVGGQCVLGFKSTAERLEERHQLPGTGHGPLAQQREFPLHGDPVGAARDLKNKAKRDIKTP